MNKNYYELLEVDRNASPEIIEKAYKTLAKKYHPDLQDNMHKKQAEEILKKINEAYETLSNPQAKALYDQKLKDTIISQDKYNEMYTQNQVLKNRLNNLQQHIHNESHGFQNENSIHQQNDYIRNNPYTSEPTEQIRQQYQKNLEYEQQVNQAREQAYHNAYMQDLRNSGYKIKYKKTLSDFIKMIISILIVLLVLFLLWQIPFIKNYFVDLYHTNPIFRLIGNIFINLFS